ncbi:MAG: restriction endonuclease [Bacteroidota bacterium]
MSKQGDEFESLTELIFKKLVTDSQFSSVQKNVKLDGRDGKRQIDVLLISNTAGFELKTIIECKDFSAKVSVGKVDELHSKMADINANKGILVSRKGFSSMAIAKAKRLGISLCTAHEALSDKWGIDIEIPIILTEVQPIAINPHGEFTTSLQITFRKDSIKTVNDVNIMDVFHENWKNNKILHNLSEAEQIYIPSEITPPFFIRDINNSKVNLELFQICFQLKINHYFGYLNDKKNTQLLRNITDGTNTIFFDSNLISNYRKTFTKIKKEKIPSFEMLKLEVRVYPEFSLISEEFEMKEKK